MKQYIFLTTEGFTFQPGSEGIKAEIDNCQVLGFGDGNNPESAFQNLLQLNNYLLATTFDEAFCYELSSLKRVSFSLEDVR